MFSISSSLTRLIRNGDISRAAIYREGDYLVVWADFGCCNFSVTVKAYTWLRCYEKLLQVANNYHDGDYQ